MTDTLALIRQFEALAEDHDELAARIIDDLKENPQARAQIEALERTRSVLRAAQTTMIVEAAALLKEQETGRTLRHIVFGDGPRVYHQ